MRRIVLHRKPAAKRSVINRTGVIIATAVVLGLTLAGCGKSGVNINNAPYVPKIVVEGYLYPGSSVSKIRLMRNFPISAPVDTSSLYLTPSSNDVRVSINGSQLTFDPSTQTYFDNQMNVGYGKTYTLEVYATIDGSQLHTTSSTTTPESGFRIITRKLGSFPYNSQFIALTYLPSPGTQFYAFSIVPDSASTDNFIYNNVFRRNLDSATVAKNINNFRFHGSVQQGIDSYSSSAFTMPIQSNQTWFYGKYTVVGYAGDSNFMNYVITAPSVQEADGNFHEPVLIFKGDGIGVFASAITDTATFTVTK